MSWWFWGRGGAAAATEDADFKHLNGDLFLTHHLKEAIAYYLPCVGLWVSSDLKVVVD